jgi:hypothetical protein
MNLLRHSIAALCVCVIASFAQGQTSDLPVSDLVQACVTALDQGADAETYAVDLSQREGFNLGVDNRNRGLRCLKAVFEYDFIFAGGKYSSPQMEMEVALQEAEMALQQAERDRLYGLAVTQACLTEYQTDRFRALTTPVCGAVFKSVGLP